MRFDSGPRLLFEVRLTAPSIGGFVNVTNSATMEFDLVLRRA
jgi:hypothetical protein